MSSEHRRIQRERRTVSVMIGMYCRARHNGHEGALCGRCTALHDYAMERIGRCPYCLAKPTCANCPIHCYKRDQRERIRKVMRYAGPRMLARHPVLAVLHKLDGLRRVEKPSRRQRHRAGEQSS